jgi:glycerol-3-phosphate O-acyltransferase
MYGISRVSTVTPQALLSASLLAHRRRGIAAREVTERVSLLRRIAEARGAPLSPTLAQASSDPTVPGSVYDAMRTFEADGLIRTQQAKGEVIYQPEESRRGEMSFAKNTLLNLVAPASLVSNALLAAHGAAAYADVEARALFASRLFKLEFIYRVGATFEVIFGETVEELVRLGLVSRDGSSLSPAPAARPQVEFLADLTRDYFEAYWLAALTLADVAKVGAMDRKSFVKAAMENGRAEFLAGRLGLAEAMSKTSVENALSFLLEQGFLVEKDRRLELGPAGASPEARERFSDEIRGYVERRRGAE